MLLPYGQPDVGAFFALYPVAAVDAAEVCPDSPLPLLQDPSLSPAEWAESVLHFHPDPIQVDVLNHDAHRLILCCSRQWGKSTIIAIKAFHHAIHNPGVEILITADTEVHGGIIVGKIAAYAASLAIPARRAHGKKYSVLLPNGSTIFAVAATERAVVGFTASIVIVDEAAITPDAVISYLTRTLSRTNGRLWLLSTPRGQIGLFCAIWHDESPNWHRVKATVDDTPYISPEFLEEQRRLFPDTFRQEFYCEFLQPPGRLLSRERFAKNVDPALNCRIISDED